MVQSKCAEIAHEEEERKLRHKVNIVSTMSHLQYFFMWDTVLFYVKYSKYIVYP